MTLPEFFFDKFGKHEPSPLEIDKWRLAETRQYLNSPVFAIKNYYKIANKDGDIVPIVPFVGQAILSVCLESQRRKGYAQRVAECKPRQIGWTTWCIAEGVHVASHPNKKVFILVNDEDVAVAKSRDLNTMVNGLPPHFQPKRRIQNLKHLLFENPNPKDRQFNPGLNSEIQIGVPTSMRGTTPHFVVISEYDHMDEQRREEVDTGLLSAMGLRKSSAVVIDTTPNGPGGSYHELIMDSCERNPKWVRRLETVIDITADEVFAGKLGEPDRPQDGWVVAFSTWMVHDEYSTRNLNPRGELPRITKATLDEFLLDIGKNRLYDEGEEQELHERGVSPYRLYWRRKKIDTLQQPSQEMKLLTFRQEFASTIAGSFVNYDKSPFDRECLDAVVRRGRNPLAAGILRERNGTIGVDTTFHSNWQEVRIHEAPLGGSKYSMGVDTGIRYASESADAWVAQVVKWPENKVCATYKARVDEHTFCEQLYLLYRWYNNPYYAVELAGSGFRVMQMCIEMGMHHFYSWKRHDAEMPEPTKYPGWETNRWTRPWMDQTLVELICNRETEFPFRPSPDIIIPDLETLQELQAVKRTNTGAIKNDSGHDDHVDALGIALCLARDGWGGFHKKREGEAYAPEEKREFNKLFANAVGSKFFRGRASDRNHPDLSNL